MPHVAESGVRCIKRTFRFQRVAAMRAFLRRNECVREQEPGPNHTINLIQLQRIGA